MLTDAIIAKGLRLDAERTQGEWVLDGYDFWHIGTGYERVTGDQVDPHRYTGIKTDKSLAESPLLKCNVEFIIHAVKTHAAALREVGRLREEVKRLSQRTVYDVVPLRSDARAGTVIVHKEANNG